MAIVVQTNVASLIAQNNLTTSTASLNKAMERMSTGYKINSAKDDAAGLYVATSLDKNIRGSEVAKQNVQMGNDMLAVAEADYVSIQDNLLRIRDLTLTALNGVYDANSLGAIGSEVAARVDEINRTADVSQYNGLSLLNTEAGNVTLQVGANFSDNDKIIIEGVFKDASAAALQLSVTSGTGIYTPSQTTTTPDGSGGSGGGTGGGLGGSFGGSLTPSTPTPTVTPASGLFAWDGSAAGRATIDANLKAFAASIDTALTNVQNSRTAIGAYQNRLDSTAQSLTTSIENLTSSKSTIMDADIAAESSRFVSAQILQQAAGSLLVQANQAPQIALSLI